MGYGLELFLDPVIIHQEFVCIICHGVMKDPVMVEECEHIYCSSCITEWMSTSESCPIDRGPIIDPNYLRTPIPAYMNLLNKLQLHCGFDGCSTITTLGDMGNHMESCSHNPDTMLDCAQGCGGKYKRKESVSHVCIEYWKGLLAQKETKLRAKKGEIGRLEESIKEVQTRLGNQLQAKKGEYDTISNADFQRLLAHSKKVSELERILGDKTKEVVKLQEKLRAKKYEVGRQKSSGGGVKRKM